MFGNFRGCVVFAIGRGFAEGEKSLPANARGIVHPCLVLLRVAAGRRFLVAGLLARRLESRGECVRRVLARLPLLGVLVIDVNRVDPLGVSRVFLF